MKKLTYLLTTIVVFSMVACGTKELNKEEKHMVEYSPWLYEINDDYISEIDFYKDRIFHEEVILAGTLQDPVVCGTIDGTWKVEECGRMGLFRTLSVKYDLNTLNATEYKNALSKYYSDENKARKENLWKRKVYGFPIYHITEEGDIENSDGEIILWSIGRE